MSRSAFAIKSAALGLAFAVHLVALDAIFKDTPIELEGASGGTVARLGTSFADMAASVAQPVTPDTSEAQQPQDTAVAQKVQPLAAEPVTPVQPVTPIQPVTSVPPSQTVRSAQVPHTETPAVQPSQTITPSTAVASQPVLVAKSVTPQEASPAQPASATDKQSPSQVDVQKPQKIQPPQVTPTTPVETTQAQAEPKPVQHPVQKPKPAPKVQPKAAPSVASVASVAGQSDGVKTAKTASAGTSGQSKAAGNAAASNYPGKVLRRIQRIPRPRIRTQGRAQVSFRIAANGGLETARISKSSGSAKLDQAALRIIKKAAPFPKPPQGAQRSYSVFIESR